MTTEMVDAAGLRSTVNRTARTNRRLAVQNERLTRMVLMQRIKEGDIDFSDGLAVLDEYRPEFTDDEDYSTAFSTEAITAWLAGRQR